MFRFVLMSLMLYLTNALCTVSHDELWKCILDKKCVNVYQLHAMSMHKSKSKSYYQRPFILAMEGPKYRRLFEDCDADKNGCIDMHDVEASQDTCQRSCMWRRTMKNMVC